MDSIISTDIKNINKFEKEKKKKKYTKFINLGISAIIASNVILSSGFIDVIKSYAVNKDFMDKGQEYSQLENINVLSNTKETILEKYDLYGNYILNKMLDSPPEKYSLNLQEGQVKYVLAKAEAYNVLKKIDYRVNIEQKPTYDVSVEDKNYVYSYNCDITLTHYQDGEIINIGTAWSRHLTQQITDTQKEMYSQFIALHERVHCEFAKINYENFISDNEIVKNKDNFDKLNNFSIRGSSYKSLLNENYADVGAIILLYKIYGKENKDLEIALNLIADMRATYDVDIPRTGVVKHLTYWSVNEMLKQENIDKAISVNNNKDFNELALDIANKGVSKSLTVKAQDQEQYSLSIEEVGNNIKKSRELILANYLNQKKEIKKLN